jgi:hypothetical protein
VLKGLKLETDHPGYLVYRRGSDHFGTVNCKLEAKPEYFKVFPEFTTGKHFLILCSCLAVKYNFILELRSNFLSGHLIKLKGIEIQEPQRFHDLANIEVNREWMHIFIYGLLNKVADNKNLIIAIFNQMIMHN